MRTKVVSFFIFFKSFQTKKIKAQRPKMTKIASRGGGGGPALIKPECSASTPTDSTTLLFGFQECRFPSTHNHLAGLDWSSVLDRESSDIAARNWHEILSWLCRVLSLKSKSLLDHTTKCGTRHYFAEQLPTRSFLEAL